MGLPPGATYFIIVIALSGIDMVMRLTLHLFVVFFAVISTVTPPDGNPIDTFGARLVIIPFVFVYHARLYKKSPHLLGELKVCGMC